MYLKLNILILLVLSTFWAKAQSTEPSQDSVYIAHYLQKWNSSKTYLLDVINAMPEDKVDFKPHESSKSFRDISLHIVGNMVWLSEDYFEGGKFETEYENRDLNKNELIEIIESAYDESTDVFDCICSDYFVTTNQLWLSIQIAGTDIASATVSRLGFHIYQYDYRVLSHPTRTRYINVLTLDLLS